MDSTVSRRARKRPNYCRKGDCFRKPSPTKTTSGSATAAMSRSSRDSASSGFCIIRKRRKRSRLLKNISSASSRSIGRKFTSNGSRTFRTGASAAKFGGDIEFQRGIAEMKPAFRSHLRAKVGRSEERRVGKECRSRWSPYYQKKKWIRSTSKEWLLLRKAWIRYQMWTVTTQHI